MTSAPPLYQGIVGFAISVAPVVVVLALVYRRRVTRLAGATALVLWGLFILVLEHGMFGITEFGGNDVLGHTAFHFQMLAAYGLAALALVGVVVAPLIRRGDPIGWFGLVVLVVIGVGAEVATAAVTTPHGVPPRWWSWGLALWAYPVAWGVALALSFRPIFGHDLSVTGELTPRAGLFTSARDNAHLGRDQPTGEEDHPAT